MFFPFYIFHFCLLTPCSHISLSCTIYRYGKISAKQSAKQGRSDGGISVFIPRKSAQVNFLRGKNDVRTAIQQFYTPKNFYTALKQISGYAPGAKWLLCSPTPPHPTQRTALWIQSLVCLSLCRMHLLSNKKLSKAKDWFLCHEHNWRRSESKSQGQKVI